MKKIIIVLFLFTLIFLFKNNNEEFIIPDNAIRFRVIANSNAFEDQITKMEIKNNIEEILKDDLINIKSKEKANEVIEKNLSNIDNLIKNYNIPYKINYGANFFPEKSYKGIKYEEGIYESLVVTLGSGKGDNWWCILYPPLCLMEKDKNDIENIDYRFFVKDVFKKYM